MSADIDALRASMRAAQPSGKGQYIEEGRHLLEIDKCFCKRTSIDGRWKETYICEFKVIESTNPTHTPGSTRSYAENPENAGWMGRFKSFLCAAVGATDENKLSVQDEDTISDVIAALRYDEHRIAKGWPENFLKSRRVTCEGMKGTSRGGTPITNKKWAPAPPVAA
jgi:hypothetical protein